MSRYTMRRTWPDDPGSLKASGGQRTSHPSHPICDEGEDPMNWRGFIGFLTFGLVGSTKETNHPMNHPMISPPMSHPMTPGPDRPRWFGKGILSAPPAGAICFITRRSARTAVPSGWCARRARGQSRRSRAPRSITLPHIAQHRVVTSSERLGQACYAVRHRCNAADLHRIGHRDESHDAKGQGNQQTNLASPVLRFDHRVVTWVTISASATVTG